MRLIAKTPIVIRGEEITHLDADGYKHLPRATSLPDGKVLATSGGKWAPSDLSGISVSSVFGRTGAVAAQAGDYTAAQVGAEPYAGVPAQTSFWRSTAAGVRAWVQLVVADITDLAVTLAAYLTKLNPTYTGRLTGPTQYLEADEQILLAIRRPGGNSGRIHGVAFQAQNDASAWVEFGRAMTYISSVAAGAHTGGMRLMAYKDGAILQALEAGPDGVRVGSGLPLQMGTTTIVDSSRNGTFKSLTSEENVFLPYSVIWKSGAANYFSLYATSLEFGLRDLSDGGSIVSYPFIAKRGVGGEVQIGYSGGLRPVRIGGTLKNDALAGIGARALVALTDGTIDDQDAATFRTTIGALASSLKGAANGVAELGADGRVPTSQLPSYVDDVLEYATFSAFPDPGEAGKIYINLDQNRTWRWSGSGYAEVSASLALGETWASAYRGDRGKIAYDHSQTTGNPHGTTAEDVGAWPEVSLGGAIDFHNINGGQTCIAKIDGTSYANAPYLGSQLVGYGGTLIQSRAANGNLLLFWLDGRTSMTYMQGYAVGVGWGAWLEVWNSFNLPAGTTGKNVLAASSQSAARSAIGALPTASPAFTGTLSGPSAILSGLSSDAGKLVRIGTGGAIEASAVTEGVGTLGDSSGLRTAFARPVALAAAGGTWGGSSYTGWTPSVWLPISDDTLGNTIAALSSGWLWNSQRVNGITIVDGAASNPYRGRLRADRWVGVSDASVTGTTSATSWFAAGTGDGSPTIPANFLKMGRRVTERARIFTLSCAADSAPQVQLKVGSTVVATVSHAFTVAAGGSINIKVEADAYIDDGGGLNVVGEARFLHSAAGEYVKPIAYYEASFDATTARAIDMTIKPHTTGETWRRALAVLEI